MADNGRVKDTGQYPAHGEFVVNRPPRAISSSGDFPPEIGEPDYLGLRLAPFSK